MLLNSIDLDGAMTGYDLDLVKSITSSVGIPVIACGGAGSVQDLINVVKKGGASAAGAGSVFVYQGKNRSVLINYPRATDLLGMLEEGETEHE